MTMHTITKKTIREGVFYKIDKNYKMQLSVYSNGHFYLSTNAAKHLGLKTSDFVEMVFTDDNFYIQKSHFKYGFKAAEHPEKSKRFYRFVSRKLSRFLINRFKPKKYKPLKFVLEPAVSKNNLLKLILVR